MLLGSRRVVHVCGDVIVCFRTHLRELFEILRDFQQNEENLQNRIVFKMLVAGNAIVCFHFVLRNTCKLAENIVFLKIKEVFGVFFNFRIYVCGHVVICFQTFAYVFRAECIFVFFRFEHNLSDVM